MKQSSQGEPSIEKGNPVTREHPLESKYNGLPNISVLEWLEGVAETHYSPLSFYGSPIEIQSLTYPTNTHQVSSFWEPSSPGKESQGHQCSP